MSQPPPLPPAGGPPPLPSAGSSLNPPPVQKSSNKKIVLWGCGILLVLFLLVAAAVAAGFYFVKKKADEKGFHLSDIAKASENETLLAAKMIAAMSNGEITVLSADDTKKTVTIRIKSSGQTKTLNLNDLSEGKFMDLPSEALSVPSQESAAGSPQEDVENSEPVPPPPSTVNEVAPVLAVMSEATLKKFPSWVPAYPGAKTITATFQDEEGSSQGQHSFFTNDDGDKVVSYFIEKLTADGLKMEKEEMATGNQMIYTVHGATQDDAKKVNLEIVKDAGGTQVTLVFFTSPPISQAP